LHTWANDMPISAGSIYRPVHSRLFPNGGLNKIFGPRLENGVIIITATNTVSHW
jgi:hypothetical protein